jgi:hypothetical protein
VAKQFGDEQRQAIWRALDDGTDAAAVGRRLGHDWRTCRTEQKRVIPAEPDVVIGNGTTIENLWRAVDSMASGALLA